MKSITDTDESRRRFLLYLLSTGAVFGVSGCASGPVVQQAMPMPKAMPGDMSIFSIMGQATVNGVTATLKTPVNPGDIVETGPDSEIVFVVEKDSVLLRQNSRMQVPMKKVQGVYTLETGAALTVFASRQMQIRTPTAVVSIRGTGIYLESEPERSYVCTCYGTTNIATADDPGINETIVSEHHDAPKYVLGDATAANRIQPAPFKNHEDKELLMIEILCGRTTPYVVPGGVGTRRRRYL